MITRKARLFLVKYESKGLTSSFVYTENEEQAAKIAKEYNEKYNDKHFFYEEVIVKN